MSRSRIMGALGGRPWSRPTIMPRSKNPMPPEIEVVTAGKSLPHVEGIGIVQQRCADHETIAEQFDRRRREVDGLQAPSEGIDDEYVHDFIPPSSTPVIRVPRR